MTIEAVSLSLSHSHLNFDQELNVQPGKITWAQRFGRHFLSQIDRFRLSSALKVSSEPLGRSRAFPKMKSLKLNWESKQIVDYFTSSSFGGLEVLELSHYESKTSQAYQEECLKRAVSMVELNSASLREIKLGGFKKATGYKPEISSFKLPKLKVMEVPSHDSSNV